jgi:hypothetical protein
VTRHKLIAGAAALCVVGAGTGAAVAATSPAVPKRATIAAVQTTKVKINRYILNGLRWNKDVYYVRSGGTLHIVNNAPAEGPHTFSVVKRSDLPRTLKQVNNCSICNKLAQAHGADPNSDAPPKFNFVENGVGQNTAPSIDRPGDSALTGPGKGNSVDVKVTAKKGTTLRFICILHPWMQGKVLVR